MKKIVLPIILMLVLCLYANTVYAQNEISFGISINTQPQLKPRETAVVYAKGINNGEVAFNMNITILDDGGLTVTVYPEHIEDISINEQFFVKITFTTNQTTEATYRVKVEFLAYTTPEVEGVGATLTSSIIINFSVFVSPNANTTVEEQPLGFYIPPQEVIRPKLPIVEIAIGTLIVIVFIVALILWLKRGKKYV